MIKFEDVFENLPMPVMIINNNGKIIKMNRSQELQSRIKREDVIGKSVDETFKSLIEQNDYDRYYWRLIKKKEPFSVLFHNVPAQFYDSLCSGRATGAPLSSGNGYIVSFEVSEEIRQDKHLLEELNRQLSKNNDFMKNLLDSSPNAVLVSDKNHLITSANKTAEIIFGRSPGELLFNDISILFEKKNTLSEASEFIGMKRSAEVNCRTKNHEIFPARMKRTKINKDPGRGASTLYIIEDISYEKSIEMSLSERLKFEMFLSELSATFVNVKPGEIDDKINLALNQIGTFLGIDRCRLIQYENKKYINSYSWAKNNIDAIPVHQVVNGFPWIFDEVVQKKALVQISGMGDFPENEAEDRKNAQKFKIKSHLNIPLIVNQDVVGSFSLDQVVCKRAWATDLGVRLKIIGEVLLNALLKKSSEEKLQKAFVEIKSLKSRIENERNYLREEIKLEHNFENIIGQSQALKSVLLKIEQVATTDATTLVLGKTGTGKELFARAIHSKSKRCESPLIKVNCANLPSNLIESELFGHEKGAFTGAHTRRKGRFELADNATIFLDEVGELPLETQGKLLSFLQEGEFERMGSSQTLKVDVRVIAATNRNLEEEVLAGRFRKDLFYRLNVFPITAPLLRSRREDIPLLAMFLMKNFCKKMGKQIDVVDPETMNRLKAYSWPGNVRELENIIERAVINTRGNVLILQDTLFCDPVEQESRQKRTKLSDVERDYILKILEETKWQIEGKKGAAVILDIPPSTLRARMNKLDLRRP